MERRVSYHSNWLRVGERKFLIPDLVFSFNESRLSPRSLKSAAMYS